MSCEYLVRSHWRRDHGEVDEVPVEDEGAVLEVEASVVTSVDRVSHGKGPRPAGGRPQLPQHFLQEEIVHSKAVYFELTSGFKVKGTTTNVYSISIPFVGSRQPLNFHLQFCSNDKRVNLSTSAIEHSALRRQ